MPTRKCVLGWCDCKITQRTSGTWDHPRRARRYTAIRGLRHFRHDERAPIVMHLTKKMGKAVAATWNLALFGVTASSVTPASESATTRGHAEGLLAAAPVGAVQVSASEDTACAVMTDVHAQCDNCRARGLTVDEALVAGDLGSGVSTLRGTLKNVRIASPCSYSASVSSRPPSPARPQRIVSSICRPIRAHG